MAEKCRNCGSKVYLDTRYCPYCGYEIGGYRSDELTPSGKRLMLPVGVLILVSATISIGLAFYILILRFSSPSSIPDLKILIILPLLAVFTLIISLITSKLISKKKLYEYPEIPSFSPYESVLDEIKFVTERSSFNIYDIFLTDQHLILCYLDHIWVGYNSPASIRNLTLKKRLRAKEEEIQLLKNDLVKLSTYNGRNFCIPKDNVEEIVFKKRPFKIFKIILSPEYRSSKAMVRKFHLMYDVKLSGQDRSYVKSILEKHFPSRVKEEV